MAIGYRRSLSVHHNITISSSAAAASSFYWCCGVFLFSQWFVLFSPRICVSKRNFACTFVIQSIFSSHFFHGGHHCFGRCYGCWCSCVAVAVDVPLRAVCINWVSAPLVSHCWRESTKEEKKAYSVLCVREHTQQRQHTNSDFTSFYALWFVCSKMMKKKRVRKRNKTQLEIEKYIYLNACPRWRWPRPWRRRQ